MGQQDSRQQSAQQSQPQQSTQPSPPARYMALRGCDYVNTDDKRQHAECGEELKSPKPEDAKELCALRAAVEARPEVINAIHVLMNVAPHELTSIKQALGMRQ